MFSICLLLVKIIILVFLIGICKAAVTAADLYDFLDNFHSSYSLLVL